MNTAEFADPVIEDNRAEEATSMEACDDFDLPKSSGRYCPTELLATFTLLMAGHGRCVSSSMMLGDREYAMWQLARAQTVADEELRRTAVRLFAYFDDAHGWSHRH
ncbi:hypothetical protein [Ramlibacter sp. Leaf400]|uniref:hypothetical protein n=1 Tax=Ramlibacter sp. Leaf400 TaxID=1736365 RepID=UPI0006F99BD0|nr:hypothetical protein [Ramlibacter sp. Leaf400]KQT09560.1 hypothetical protein ASG30_13430 [Ramlibacter sp. Leaf400]